MSTFFPLFFDVIPSFLFLFFPMPRYRPPFPVLETFLSVDAALSARLPLSLNTPNPFFLFDIFSLSFGPFSNFFNGVRRSVSAGTVLFFLT